MTGTQTFYHGTHSAVEDSIRAKGLTGTVVYVTEDLEIAEMYAQLRSDQFEDFPLLVRVTLTWESILPDANSEDDRHSWVHQGAIPPSAIASMEKLILG